MDTTPIRKVYIGRGGPFGNPFTGNNPLSGETLNDYRVYLWRRINRDPKFTSSVKALLPEIDNLWCPGCGPRGHNCEENICHGSILKKAIKWLNR